MDIPEMIPPMFGEEESIEVLKTNRIALIDADKIKHLVTYDIGKSIENNDIYGKSLEEFAQERLDNIFNWIDALGYVFCFSGKSFNTFRYHNAITKEYKGSRKFKEAYPDQGKDMFKVV